MSSKIKDFFYEIFTHPTTGSNIAYIPPTGGIVPPAGQPRAHKKIVLRENGNYAGLDLSGVDLSGFVLKGANLSGTMLTNTVLSGVDFTGADLTGANFQNANISGAAFDQAALNGANFEGVTYTVPPSGLDITGGANAAG